MSQITDWLEIAIEIAVIIVPLALVLWPGLAVWHRLGKGLAKRKIAIFAEDEFEPLKAILTDSKLFKEKNIVQIARNEIGKEERCSLLLVHYKPFAKHMEEILQRKKDSTALIVYAPSEEGRLEQEVMNNINARRNSLIVNFRGRLLNDVFISMITTSAD